MMTVLITGASSGIGAGLAKSFAADGHLVIACGRDASRLAALQQFSPNISVRLFDMTDRDACRQALTGCFADLIILCAGTCEYLDHGQVDAALVERVMATNFLGPVNCLAALQTQLEAGDRVVLVSSMAHWMPFPRAEAYGASKAALSWFANSLRLDWEPKGVAVTVVSPGFVDTPLTRKNDFAMPGRVSVDRAVAAIRHGLAKGKNHIAFPTGFSLALRLLASLPSGIQRLLLRRMVRLMNIAIIGSGIAGLTCAWRLAGHHQVTLFEAGATPGGHTATVDVATPQGTSGHRYRIYRLQRSHLSALYGPAQRAGDRRAKNADELLGPQPGQRPGIQRPQPDLALRPAAQSAEAGLLGTAERDRPLQPPGETGADRGAGSRRDAGELLARHRFSPFFARHYIPADGGGHLVVVAAGDAPLPAAAVFALL